ncbi:hypothetical protein D3C75_1124630 [compost metagenome]
MADSFLLGCEYFFEGIHLNRITKLRSCSVRLYVADIIHMETSMGQRPFDYLLL